MKSKLTGQEKDYFKKRLLEKEESRVYKVDPELANKKLELAKKRKKLNINLTAW